MHKGDNDGNNNSDYYYLFIYSCVIVVIVGSFVKIITTLSWHYQQQQTPRILSAAILHVSLNTVMSVDEEKGDFILLLAHGLPNSVFRGHIHGVETLTTSVMKRGCGEWGWD